MTPRVRLVVFLAAAAVFGVVLVAGLAGMPSFGHYRGPYGIVLGHLAVPQRQATDVVTAVNFDYRAFDTMGEEFILFAAVLGLAILLRERRGEHERAPDTRRDEHHFPGTSSALGGLGVALIGPVLVLGLYIVTHGHLSPGGGFQGGVILASALLVVFLSGEYMLMKLVAPHAMVEVAEAAGAAAYALIGVGGLIFAAAFFENFIALGSAGKLLSAGTIPLSNIGVGVEVCGAFVLLWSEFLDQALLIRGRVMLGYVVAAWLVLIGLYGIVTSRNLIHAVICLSVVQSGTYVLLLSIGYVAGGTAPVFPDQPLGTVVVDPVVQALTLTDVVVEAAVTALLLALAVQADKRFGTVDPNALRPLKG